MIYRYATPALLVVLLAALWSGNAPHLHDFAEWLYQSRILLLKFTHPEQVAGFQLAHYPVPNSMAVIILSGIGLALSPVLAGKTFLTLLLAAWLWVLRTFVRRIAPASAELQESLLLLLFGLVAASSFFWTGFIGYQFGLLFLTLFLARYHEKTPPIEYAAFAIVLFLSHAMVFLALSLLLASHVGCARMRRRPLPALIISAALSMWFVIGRSQSDYHPPFAGASMANWQEIVMYKLGYPLMLGPFKNLLGADLTSPLDGLPWLYWSGVAANLLVLGALALLGLKILMGKPAHTAPNLPRTAPAKALLVAAGCLLIFYFLAPYNFFGLINPAGRILLPLLLILMLLAQARGQIPQLQPMLRVIAPTTLLFSGVTSLCYLTLMLDVSTSDPLPTPPRPQSAAPTDSVFAYNNWLYGQTAYRYFNYRIFSFAERYEQMNANQYPSLGFDTGLLIGYRAAP